MSFSLSIPDTTVDELPDAIDQAAATLGLTDETRESLEAAKAAALALAASGVVGRGRVTGSLSGHANPGHVPTEGYANDCVTVSLSALGSPEPPEPAAVEESAPE